MSSDSSTSPSPNSDSDSSQVSFSAEIDPLGFYTKIRERVENVAEYGLKGNVPTRIPKVLDLALSRQEAVCDSVGFYDKFLTEGFKVYLNSGKTLDITTPGDDIPQDKIDALVAAGTVAPFGKGSETVVDPKVRNAVEIPAARIYLSANPLHDWQIRKCLGAMTANVSARLYKMHIYQTGGHFKEHLDTLHSKNHVATLVVGVGGQYTGGELEVDGVKYDLHPSDHASKFVFFYTDQPHKVHPVTSGTRVVLQFDIFIEGGEEEDDEDDDDNDDVYALTRDTNEDEKAHIEEKRAEVIIQGVKEELAQETNASAIGIPCAHLYPLGALDDVNLLKGADRSRHALLIKHFNVRLQGLMINQTKDHSGTRHVRTVSIGDILHPAKKRRRLCYDEVKPSEFTLLWMPSRTGGCVLDESPFIEHTGNESQEGHLLYHSVCMVVSEKSNAD